MPKCDPAEKLNRSLDILAVKSWYSRLCLAKILSVAFVAYSLRLREFGEAPSRAPQRRGLSHRKQARFGWMEFWRGTGVLGGHSDSDQRQCDDQCSRRFAGCGQRHIRGQLYTRRQQFLDVKLCHWHIIGGDGDPGDADHHLR